MRWPVLAVAALVLAGCRVSLIDRKVPPLPLEDVGLSFRSPEEGALSFAFDLPPGAGDVHSVWWDVVLDGRRFATGVEGAPELTENSDGGWRVRVTSPVVLGHLGFREGPTYVNVLVRGEVRLKRAGVDERLPFEGGREFLTKGAPVTRERIQE